MEPLIPMREMSHLFANNRAWADQIRTEDPEFFRKLCHQQAPRYFWIGCSDSRVPANQITGLLLGEMFVHRNVASRIYFSPRLIAFGVGLVHAITKNGHVVTVREKTKNISGQFLFMCPLENMRLFFSLMDGRGLPFLPRWALPIPNPAIRHPNDFRVSTPT
jgi:hypothetical protein